MTFEQWKIRPVAIAQCFSFQEYKKLNLPWWWFRVVSKYRKPIFLDARKIISNKIKEMRKNGLTFREVKQIALKRINSPIGDAERVNFDEMLDILE